MWGYEVSAVAPSRCTYFCSNCIILKKCCVFIILLNHFQFPCQNTNYVSVGSKTNNTQNEWKQRKHDSTTAVANLLVYFAFEFGNIFPFRIFLSPLVWEEFLLVIISFPQAIAFNHSSPFSPFTRQQFAFALKPFACRRTEAHRHTHLLKCSLIWKKKGNELPLLVPHAVVAYKHERVMPMEEYSWASIICRFISLFCCWQTQFGHMQTIIGIPYGGRNKEVVPTKRKKVLLRNTNINWKAKIPTKSGI